MASIIKGRLHLEVWDILCPECMDRFWSTDRTQPNFLSKICCQDCKKRLMESVYKDKL